MKWFRRAPLLVALGLCSCIVDPDGLGEGDQGTGSDAAHESDDGRPPREPTGSARQPPAAQVDAGSAEGVEDGAEADGGVADAGGDGRGGRSPDACEREWQPESATCEVQCQWLADCALAAHGRRTSHKVRYVNSILGVVEAV